MLQTIHFLRSTTGDVAAIVRMCRAFNLNDSQIERVLNELESK